MTPLEKYKAQRKYAKTPKGKAAAKKWRQSEKGKLFFSQQPPRIRNRKYWRKKRGKYLRRLRVTLPIIIEIERDGDTVYAWCPMFLGLHTTQGYCINNAVANVKQAAQAFVESLIKQGEVIPTSLSQERKGCSVLRVTATETI